MKPVFLTILTAVFCVSLMHSNLPEKLSGPNFWDCLFKYTGISDKVRDSDKETDVVFKQLKDKKEDLDYLQDQIDRLTLGLKEMPDQDQNRCFRDLLTGFQDKERILNHEISQIEQRYQKELQNASGQETIPTSFLPQQDQENIRERMQRMDDLMASNQLRLQDQMQRMNDLIDLDQMHLNALIERMNDLVDRN